MAWTKMKAVVVVGLTIIVAAGTTTVSAKNAIASEDSSLKQQLEDGSVLSLNRLSFGIKNEFEHGDRIQKFTVPGKEQLVAEFRLQGKNATNHPLVQPDVFGQFRFVIRGETGIEYVAELYSQRQFTSYADGYFGYIALGSFPRTSRSLFIRLEKREKAAPGLAQRVPWRTLAEFKIANPAKAAKREWVAAPAPSTQRIRNMDFTLKEITVQNFTEAQNNIWNHRVTVPTEVRTNGLLLENWQLVYNYAEDASGNWIFLKNDRSLDPQFVWKLEMDFEPTSNILPGGLAVISVPVKLSAAPIMTNILGVPVTLSWTKSSESLWGGANPPPWGRRAILAVNIPTNRLDIGVRCVLVEDKLGHSLDGPIPNPLQPGQHNFLRLLQFPKGEEKQQDVQVTIAIVPNVHVTFYAQPRLLRPPIEKNTLQ
jgi:hypothetical protein